MRYHRIVSSIPDSISTWRMLRRFCDVNYTAELIAARHKVSKKHIPNCRKQAQQIRYCLKQAEEYFQAARSVSLATQPLLLYYGVMSLAVAEFMLKQEGMVSLEKARGKHGSHGLDLVTQSPVGQNLPNATSGGIRAASLIARPKQISGEYRGTFELWHRSATEYPIVGKETRHYSDYKSTGYSLIAAGADTSLSKLSATGINLLECFASMPFLRETLPICKITPNFAKASAERVINIPENLFYTTITLHPNHSSLIEKVAEQFLFPPPYIRNIDIKEFASGFALKMTDELGGDNGRLENYDSSGRFPMATQYNAKELFFCTQNDGLNEFGYIYVALFILGNLARYYPDKWMYEVENSTDLSVISDHFLQEAQVRGPLLVLSEFSGDFFVQA